MKPVLSDSFQRFLLPSEFFIEGTFRIRDNYENSHQNVFS
jgi:hypothetical protein